MNKNNDSIHTPIFIGGLMKSGTSLLRKLLSLHPHIFGGLETHWFSPEFIENWQDESARRQKWLRAFYELSESEILQLRKRSNTSFEFTQNVLSYCTSRVGKNRWVEKTPDNIFHTDLIWEQWPDAKIISLNRDLKDVFASWKKHKAKEIDDFIPVAEKFYIQVNKCLPNKNFLLINYEDLVLDTSETLKGVCHFLEEPYIADLVDYQGDKSDYEKVLAVTGKASPTTESLAKPIFNSSIGQWKTILNSEEVSVINQLPVVKV